MRNTEQCIKAEGNKCTNTKADDSFINTNKYKIIRNTKVLQIIITKEDDSFNCKVCKIKVKYYCRAENKFFFYCKPG